MKYCVSARQPKNIIQKADEIKFEYRDIGALIDYVEDYPDKDFVIAVPGIADLATAPWEDLKAYGEKVHITFIITNFKQVDILKENGFDYYWMYPATTWSEIRGLLTMGVSQILIGGPLMFEMDKLGREILLPLRAIPHIAFNGIIPHKDGICGEYIRPEDLQLYGDVITTIEFRAKDLAQEASLLDIYQSGVWHGNLNLLIVNLNYNVDNRGIAQDFGERRMTCGQRCMENHNGCHFCESAFLLCRMIDTKLHEAKQ